MHDRRSRERRSTKRSRTLKGAKIIIGSSSVIDCIVRNLTNTGARIRIQNTVNLPEVFDLTLDGGYSFRSCRIKWRSITETGLQFI